ITDSDEAVAREGRDTDGAIVREKGIFLRRWQVISDARCLIESSNTGLFASLLCSRRCPHKIQPPIQGTATRRARSRFRDELVCYKGVMLPHEIKVSEMADGGSDELHIAALLRGGDRPLIPRLGTS